MFQSMGAVVLSVHNFLMVYWWPISSNVFYRNMRFFCLFLCSQNCETWKFFAQNMPKTIDWLESQLTQVPILCLSTDGELFCSSPIRLKSQTAVHWLTLKIFGLSPSRLKSLLSVRRMSLKIFWSRPSLLSCDRRRNCWLAFQLSYFWSSQPLTTHVLDVCPPTVTETKMSPIFCTVQN